ncbi:transposase family protein [Flintibacter hominis]
MQGYKTLDKTSMTLRLRTKIVSRVLRREPFTRIADNYGISDKTVPGRLMTGRKTSRYDDV